MTAPVNEAMIESWRQSALTYLRANLRDRTPDHLGPHHVFEESPLEGEGPVILFEFLMASAASDAERYFVAGGRTEPNYYSAFGLSPQDMYALHLGTRFMLVLGVALMPEPGRDSFDLEKAVRDLVWSIRPNEPVSDVEWAAAFDVEGQMHGVARCRIAGQAAYAFIGAAPPGFSTQVDIAPQAAFRIHLGRALLAERQRNGTEVDDVPATPENA